ncbi:MAG: GAF domain-containing sensor histidine kinase [Candidatus Saccharibacteria bacterium]
MNFSEDSYIALLSGRFAWATVLVGVIVFYYFIGYFPDNVRTNHAIRRLIALLAGGVLAFISILSPFVVENVLYNSGAATVVPGFLMNVFYILIVGIILLSFYELYVKYKKAIKIERSRIQLFIIGLLIFVCVSLFFSALLPIIFGIENYTFIGDYSIIIFIAFTTYAIVKHHLFDVRLAIVRSVTYSLVLITLATISLGLALTFSALFNSTASSPLQIASEVLISVLLAFLFQPLKRFFDKVTNKLFYKDNYNTDDFFARLNKSLATTTDLRNLLERVAYEIGTTLKSEQAFFFIYTNHTHYMTAGTRHHKQMPRSDALQIGIPPQNEEDHDVVIASQLETDDPIRRLMLSHRIELLLPLVQDEKAIGYLCLGDHLTSGYTNRDLRALNTISDELVIAIQNALAVNEILELNTNLQQKIKNATKELRSSNLVLRQLDKVKDEFISMASHQLRTPLTSVKGYISMVVEGDAGKITNTQKKLLNEAFMSSERMVHLINDFLNVSRIQTGKFIIDKSSVNLIKLVKEELDSLRPNATARKLKFVYNHPRKIPMINVDEGKIRQVVMNYADNAIYYSLENMVINIDLSVKDGNIIFTVKDTGIGVPVHERAQLFSKFYRASNARRQRPDGTGVGIFLAKKVIDAHGGRIIFESTENKGSTFGFSLPLK